MAKQKTRRQDAVRPTPRPQPAPSDDPAPPAWARLLTPDAIVLLLLGIVLLVLLAPVTRKLTETGSDFPFHYYVAHLIFDQHRLVTTYFYFHLLVVLVRDLLVMGYELVAAPEAAEAFRQYVQCFPPAGLTVVLLHVLLQAGVTYAILRSAFDKLVGYLPRIICGLCACALTLMTPIILLRLDAHPYFGYIVPTIFHNPTYIVLKPLALLLFWQTMRVVQGEEGFSAKKLLALLALSIISTLAKPSYAICFLPVMVGFCSYLYWQRQPRKALLLALVTLLPLVLILSFQYLKAYHGTELLPSGSQVLIDSGARLAWAPLQVMGLKTRLVLLLPKLLLSVLFPLTIYLVFARAAWRNLQLNTAWLVFLISAAYLYLLSEGGGRAADMNLIWGAMAALFILYVVSTAFLLRQTVQRQPGLRHTLGLASCWLAFLLHAASGCYWLWLQYLPQGAPW